MRHRSLRLAGPLLAASAAAALLAGCASTEVLTQAHSARDKAEEMAALAAQPATPADVSPIKVRDGVYVGATAARNEHGDPLPNGWERKRFAYARAGLSSFQEIAHGITRLTGLPVVVTAINSGTTTNVTQTGAGGGGIPSPILPPGGDPNFGAALGALGGGVSQQTIRASEPPTGNLGVVGQMAVNFDGPLPEFLDQVATSFNVAWEYKDNRIIFERFITRTFDVAALPGNMDLTFAIGGANDSSKAGGSVGGGQSAGGSVSAEQSAKIKAAFDTWKEIDDTIKTIMAREGGVAQSSPARGSVTVVSSPAGIRHVQEYLKGVNDKLAQQVAINVKVYSVVINDGDNFSSDINLLVADRFKGSTAIKSIVGIASGNAASGATTATVNGATSAVTPAGLNLVQSGSNQGVGWAILNNGRYNGSNGIANLLSQKGDVSEVTSSSQVTHNGQPVPVQVSNTRGYAAQVTAVSGSLGSGTSTTIQPGTVTTGFNLLLVPRIQRDGTVMLQYGLNLSELVGADNGFDTFTTGGNTIQLPNVNARNFIQQATIQSGYTLVLSGFEQIRASKLEQGQGQSWLWGLGGSSNSQLRREILVVAITPTIIDARAPASGVPAKVAGGL